MKWHRLGIIVWLITDSIVFLAAYCLAYFIRVGFILSTDYAFLQLLLIATLTIPFLLLCMFVTRVFGFSRRQYDVRNAAYIGFSCLISAAMFTLFNHFYFQYAVSRLMLLMAIIASFLLLWLYHILYEKALRRWLVHKQAYRTLLIGVTRESGVLIEQLQRSYHPYQPVAILDGRGAKVKEVHSVPVLGKLNKLEEVIAEYKITHLIQCSDLEQSLNLISVCRSHAICYMILPSVFGIVERDERIESLEGQPVTMVSPKSTAFNWFVR